MLIKRIYYAFTMLQLKKFISRDINCCNLSGRKFIYVGHIVHASLYALITCVVNNADIANIGQDTILNSIPLEGKLLGVLEIYGIFRHISGIFKAGCHWKFLFS